MAFCSSVPKASTRCPAPAHSPMLSWNDVQAPMKISWIRAPITVGRPMPPYSGECTGATQPFSADACQASMNPGGEVTWPSAKVAPMRSESELSGAMTSVQNRITSSSIIA